MARVMTIDDDPMICDVLSDFATSMGHEAFAAQRIAEGLASLDEFAPDLVFLDVNLPDGDGLEAIPSIIRHHSAPEVIIITGEGSVDGAALAIHNGAWDYLRKPLSVERVQLVLNRALQYRSGKSASVRSAAVHRVGIIGSSPAIKGALELLAKAAITEAPVLVTGETGTGKELFARAIHDNSPRCEHNFVVVDCASLPPTLVESILFGHEKGTFTGADQTRTGLIGQAHQGTLFLDEVGEMPLKVQKSFLRVLQEQRYRPVGGSREKVSDFRLVAATNRDLEAMAAEGEFRHDLLFRLWAFNCHLPSLRERGDDMVDIAMDHCAKMCKFSQLPNKGYCPDFLRILRQYEWPGNVRELLNVVTYAFSHAAADPILYPIHLPPEIRAKVKIQELEEDEACLGPSECAPSESGSTERDQAESGSVKESGNFGLLPPGPLPRLQELRNKTIDHLERQYLNTLLEQSGKEMNRACEISSLSLSQLYRLLRKHRIKT